MALASEAAELEHVCSALREHYNISASEIRLLDAGSTPNHAVMASSGEQFLVKALRTRLGAWVAENAEQITGFAAHAVAYGLATPAPVRTKNGALVAVVSGPETGEVTHFVVLQWAVGHQRADEVIVAQPSLACPLLATLGSSLAQLHSLPAPEGLLVPAVDAPGGHALCGVGEYLEHASNPSELLKGSDTNDANWFRSWLPAVAAVFREMPEPRVVCHCDAYLDNVLARIDSSVPTLMLIDWEDMCTASPVVDLGACAVGTCFSLSLGPGSEDVVVEFIEDRFRALASGYMQKRPLLAAERQLLCRAMQASAWSCGVFRYNRFLAGVADMKTRKYRQMIDVVNILEHLGTDGVDKLLVS